MTENTPNPPDPSPERRLDETEESADPQTEELVAFLDGELDPNTAESVRARIGSDPKLRSEAESLQKAMDALDFLPKAKPSPTFTTKTVSQVIPVLPAAISSTAPVAATMPALPTPPAPAPAWFWPFALGVILLSGVLGYAGRMLLTKNDDAEINARMLKDVGLLQNLKLYRNIDSIDFLQRLDSPDLFRDDD